MDGVKLSAQPRWDGRIRHTKTPASRHVAPYHHGFYRWDSEVERWTWEEDK